MQTIKLHVRVSPSGVDFVQKRPLRYGVTHVYQGRKYRVVNGVADILLQGTWQPSIIPASTVTTYGATYCPRDYVVSYTDSRGDRKTFESIGTAGDPIKALQDFVNYCRECGTRPANVELKGL